MDRVPDSGMPATAATPSVVVLTHLYPSPDSPGRGSFVEEQCRALSEHCDLTVVTGRWDLDTRTEESSGAIHVIAVPLRAAAGLPSTLRVANAIPGYTKAALGEIRRLDGPPDLIHAHFALPDGVTAIRVGRAVRVPVVVTLHGSDFNRQMSRPVVGALLASYIARAEGVIAVSQQIADGFSARVPHAANRVEFVPNGYDSALIRLEPKPDSGGFLFVGSLTPVKNPLVLLRAFARIASQTTRDLTMIGEGHLRPDVERAVSDFGISDRVRLLGRIPHDQLQPHFRNAHALVLPSASEGMPLVVIESLATGTPVVASAVGAIPDLVEPGRSGLLVTPGDVDELADALLRAERTPWDNAGIAQSAPIIDWAENARRVAAIYRRLIDPTSGS
ncbi:MAG: glycosyltransferase [Coriobacteriia bacterium]|nr:glycosyltransferase [Coriobacteriia bacterium]